MMPDRVTLHLAGAGPAALDLDFWDSVHGLDMSPVRCGAARLQGPRPQKPTLLESEMGLEPPFFSPPGLGPPGCCSALSPCAASEGWARRTTVLAGWGYESCLRCQVGDL